jgi:hypothetical protein
MTTWLHCLFSQVNLFYFIYWLIYFWCNWGLNSGFCTSATPPAHFAILLWLFWRWSLANNLPGLASNHDPLDLSFSSS